MHLCGSALVAARPRALAPSSSLSIAPLYRLPSILELISECAQMSLLDSNGTRGVSPQAVRAESWLSWANKAVNAYYQSIYHVLHFEPPYRDLKALLVKKGVLRAVKVNTQSTQWHQCSQIAV